MHGNSREFIFEMKTLDKNIVIMTIFKLDRQQTTI